MRSRNIYDNFKEIVEKTPYRIRVCFSAGDTMFTILLELEGRSVKVLEGGEKLAFDHGEIIADVMLTAGLL